MSPLGLYIHVPFCGSICNYCNFNRGLFDAALKDRYLRALRREIQYVAGEVNAGRHPVTGRDLPGSAEIHRPARTPADTIYFGGGTPSLLAAAEIGGIIDACRSAFAVAEDAEITLEANPETVTGERMAAYRGAGVNRVSIGVQSFRDEELRRLGRVHDAARARASVDAVHEAGIDNVSLDLMLWLPQQTVDDCLFSVRALAALGPAHASLYLLELYPNAPLREEMARAGWSLAPDEDAADMYLRAIEILAETGYEHYEISNFARPGRRARHNLKYWTDQQWLAFGCGAHSTMDGVRWKNVSGTEAYVAALERGGPPAVAERRELTSLERFQEAVFMGLRLVAGIRVGEIERRYGTDFWRRYAGQLAPFIEAGLLIREPAEGDGATGAGANGEHATPDAAKMPPPERLRLSPRGLLLSNEVFGVFIDGDGTVK